MRSVTAGKAKVMENRAEADKIEKVDPRHLFVLLWSAAQVHAGFEALAGDARHVRQLRTADVNMAAKTIMRTVLRGLVPRLS